MYYKINILRSIFHRIKPSFETKENALFSDKEKNKKKKKITICATRRTKKKNTEKDSNAKLYIF